MKHTALLSLFLSLLPALAAAQKPLAIPGLANTYFLPADGSADFEVRLQRGEQFHAAATSRSATKLVVELRDAGGRVLCTSDPVWRAREVAIMAPSSGTYHLRVRNDGDVPTLVEVVFRR